MLEKKILIIEDLADMQTLFKEELGHIFNVFSALSLEEAENVFTNYSHELSAIAVDACVPGTTPTTPPLVKKMRETFQGPMIAISSSKEYRDMLREAGCNYDCEKEALPNLLQKLFTN